MTESAIINDLYLYYGRKGKRAKLMADCIFLFHSWESDFVFLTANGYYTEVEVKISVGDYKSDFRKIERHKCLSSKIACTKPNRFFYCVPWGLIAEKDVPKYAGLIYYTPGGKFTDRFVVIRDAPFLHKTKMNLFQDLAVKLMYKYLNLRKK